MDSRIGLDLIVEDEEYTTKLGSGKTLRDIHKNRKLSWVVELHTFQSFFVHRKDLVRLQLRDRFWRITAETSQNIIIPLLLDFEYKAWNVCFEQ